MNSGKAAEHISEFSNDEEMSDLGYFMEERANRAYELTRSPSKAKASDAKTISSSSGLYSSTGNVVKRQQEDNFDYLCYESEYNATKKKVMDKKLHSSDILSDQFIAREEQSKRNRPLQEKRVGNDMPANSTDQDEIMLLKANSSRMADIIKMQIEKKHIV
eukprot:TRINITY_DN3457_c0_g1_i4.p2 TRINITY_DN3457_c0_g1~~TRINITY_DN3457_c0_g1_i4.p2  ORF type:complete len:161 (+),score=52.10 TRINITY_DN3457_c0_g1_i4:162-644(+)